jgi:hypothetical protein
MHKRFQEKKDDDYMGEGIFPFQQLAMLVSTSGAEEKSEAIHTRGTIGELSRKNVFEIANKHIKHNEKDPLTLVDTYDPTALQSSGELDSSASEMPLVAPKPVVEAYHFLVDKFQCDVMIDTSKQDANFLMGEVDRLMQTRAAQHPQ